MSDTKVTRLCTTIEGAGAEFVGFYGASNYRIIGMSMVRMEPEWRCPPMHDLLIALAFVGMVIAPAVVAATVGHETDEAD